MPGQNLSKLHVWDDECISRGRKCILYKVIVQSTLLYASETWAISKTKDAQAGWPPRNIIIVTAEQCPQEAPDKVSKEDLQSQLEGQNKQ